MNKLEGKGNKKCVGGGREKETKARVEAEGIPHQEENVKGQTHSHFHVRK
jgi:hypothetical protein